MTSIDIYEAELSCLKRVKSNFGWFSKKSNSDINECILESCQNGYLQVIRYLLKKGVDINIATEDQIRNSPIYIATREKHLDIIKCLVANGIVFENFNNTDTDDLLSMAIFEFDDYLVNKTNYENRAEIVQYLLSNGLNIRNRKIDFINELSRNRYLNIIKIFVEYGLDIEKNLDGFSEAVCRRQEDILDYLTKVGVDINKIKLEGWQTTQGIYQSESHYNRERISLEMKSTMSDIETTIDSLNKLFINSNEKDHENELINNEVKLDTDELYSLSLREMSNEIHSGFDVSVFEDDNVTTKSMVIVKIHEEEQAIKLEDILYSFSNSPAFDVCRERLTWDIRGEIKHWVSNSKYTFLDTRDEEDTVEYIFNKI